MEPSPLCRSGKLFDSSYNTHHTASRITTVASRLSINAPYILLRNNRPRRCSTRDVYTAERSGDHLSRYDVLNQQVSLLFCCLRIFFDALTSGCAECNADSLQPGAINRYLSIAMNNQVSGLLENDIPPYRMKCSVYKRRTVSDSISLASRRWKDFLCRLVNCAFHHTTPIL